MITPALLILASGSLLATVMARLARVVEQLRHAREVVGESDRLSSILKLLRQRAGHAEASLTALFVAVGFFIATCLLIAVDRFAGHALFWAPITSAILGMSMLLYASWHMVAECRVAVRQLRDEIASID